MWMICVPEENVKQTWVTIPRGSNYLTKPEAKSTQYKPNTHRPQQQRATSKQPTTDNRKHGVKNR
jgi:hypothetical protein